MLGARAITAVSGALARAASGLAERAGRVQERAIGASWQAWLRGDDLPSGPAGSGSGVDAALGTSPRRPDGLDQPWVSIAVSAIAEALAQTPWILTTTDDAIVEGGDLYDLLRRPNEQQGWMEFVEQVALNLLTTGASAIVKDVPGAASGTISGAAPGAGTGAAQGAGAGELAGALPTRLIVVDPARLTPVWSRRGSGLTPTLEGYDYLVPAEYGLGDFVGGQRVRLPAWHVIVIRRPERTRWSPLAGFSPLSTLGSTVTIGREADKYVAEYLESFAQPTAEFTTDARLTPDQTRQLRDQYYKAFRRGAGRNRVNFLAFGLKRSQTPVLEDLGLESLRRDIRAVQMGVYGVPPLAAGIVENANRSNSDAQMAMLLTGPVMTTAARIVAGLNRGLVAAHAWTAAPAGVSGSDRRGPRPVMGAGALRLSRSAAARRVPLKREQAALLRQRRRLRDGLLRMGPGSEWARRELPAAQAPASDLYLDIDFDASPVLGRLRLDLLPQVLPITGVGATLNEVLDLLDIAVERNPAGDVARVSVAVAPASAVDSAPDAAASNPAPDTPSDNPPPVGDAAPDSGGGASGRRTPRPAAAPEPDAIIKRYAAAREIALRAIRERVVRAWLPLAEALARRDGARIRRQGAGVIARASEVLKPAWPSGRGIEASRQQGIERGIERGIEDAVARVLYDLDAAEGEVTALVRPFGEAASRLGARQAAAEAGLSAEEAKNLVGVLADDPHLTRALSGMQAQFRLIERERWDAARQTIQDAFSQGKTFDALITDLETFYGGARGSAKRAAVTEVGGVLGEARYAGFVEAGVTAKAWLTTSGKPRPTHAQAEVEYGDGGNPGPIPMERDFIVGGAAMRFPADPNGPPKERINCYCVLVASERAGDGGDGGRSAGSGEAMDRVIERYADLDIPRAEDVCPELFTAEEAP